jgi:hypothetical protein
LGKTTTGRIIDPRQDLEKASLGGACEILDPLREEIPNQYAITHIDPYEGRNNIVRAQESGYLPIRIGGRVRTP